MMWMVLVFEELLKESFRMRTFLARISKKSAIMLDM